MNILIISNVNGFPYGFAFVEKIKLLAKALLYHNQQVVIINNYSVRKGRDFNQYDCKAEDIFEGIAYIYTSGSYYRPENIFKIVLSVLKAFYREILIIKSYRAQNNKITYLISYSWFPIVIYYWVLSKILGFSLIISLMEYHVAFSKNNPIRNLNYVLFDHYAVRFASKVLVISNSLKDLISKKDPLKEIFILPALADGSIFSPYKAKIEKPYYLLYCGATGYKDVIEFIIHAFNIVRKQYLIKLHLIVNGAEAELLLLNEEIRKLEFKQDIYLLSKLSRNSLSLQYLNAYALLAPIRKNNVQDIFRFPQKIAEYLASGRPIITTAFGEIPYYFTDECDAFIADDYEVNNFAFQIIKAINDPEIADSIGRRGFELFTRKFDYNKYSTSLSAFFFS